MTTIDWLIQLFLALLLVLARARPRVWGISPDDVLLHSATRNCKIASLALSVQVDAPAQALPARGIVFQL